MAGRGTLPISATRDPAIRIPACETTCPQVRGRRSIEATLGRLHSQGVSVQPPEYFGQVYRMLSHRRGEYNDIINVNPDIGQVTEDGRHHPLKLARQSLQTKGSTLKAVLDLVPREAQVVPVGGKDFELVEGTL